MKHCPNCGVIAQDDFQKHCQNCGYKFPQATAHQQQNMNQTYQAQNAYNPYQNRNMNQAYQQQQNTHNQYHNQNMNSSYQQQTSYNTYQAPNTYNTPPYATNQSELPMKWYKALIYVILFLSMVLNAFTAYRLYTGQIYVDTAIQSGIVVSDANEAEYIERVYNTFGPGLKQSDIFYVICLCFSVVFALIARQALAGFKKNAPKMIVGLYAFNFITGLIYIVWQYVVITDILPDASFDSSTISTLAMSLAMTILNSQYFKKREHLFYR